MIESPIGVDARSSKADQVGLPHFARQSVDTLCPGMARLCAASEISHPVAYR